MFQLTKGGGYFYDCEAVKEASTTGDDRRPYAPGQVDERGDGGDRGGGTERRGDASSRNKRSVWEVPTQPWPGAHFATFPERLVEPMLLAGTSARGCCPRCGAPWARVLSREFVPQPDVRDPAKLAKGSVKGMDGSSGWGNTPRGTTASRTEGWRPTCGCDAGGPVPCSVVDPFCGSGTVGAVAVRMGLRFTGAELSERYVEMSRRRISAAASLGWQESLEL